MRSCLILLISYSIVINMRILKKKKHTQQQYLEQYKNAIIIVILNYNNFRVWFMDR